MGGICLGTIMLELAKQVRLPQGNRDEHGGGGLEERKRSDFP